MLAITNFKICIIIKRSGGWINNMINIKEEFIMAYKITDACISCGTCEGQCPVGAIAAGDGKFDIDENTCVSCGSCAGSCPVGAIAEA